MRTLIVYYSRTGATRKIAKLLACRLNARISEIRCRRYNDNLFRYLLAGYESVRGILPDIDAPSVTPTDFDLVLIGSPVWTSHPALPVRAYLSNTPHLPDRVATFLTHGGHSGADKAAAELAALLAVPVERHLSVNTGNISDDELSNTIAEFAHSLLDVNHRP